ncbi:hypothetical protein ANN_02991 [Periplaneta americana]|uniref:Uncharacterized protein n=1 Tax=Periplaneta americana TaxID=6978 RepID=A0ABQ8TXT5_PERAM|nr:hypothetical protein ANN_02991 [Periplaneta americana]
MNESVVPVPFKCHRPGPGSNRNRLCYRGRLCISSFVNAIQTIRNSAQLSREISENENPKKHHVKLPVLNAVLPVCRNAITDVYILDVEESAANLVYHAGFVLLEDCGHSIEAKGLEEWLNIHDDQKDIQIETKVCPLCKTPINRTQRFMNVVKAQYNDVLTIKRRVFGDVAAIRRKEEALVRKLNSRSFYTAPETGPTMAFAPSVHTSMQLSQGENVERLQRYCNVPCDTVLECGHQCSGTCYGCYQDVYIWSVLCHVILHQHCSFEKSKVILKNIQYRYVTSRLIQFLSINKSPFEWKTSHRCLIDLRTRSQTPGVLRISSEHATIRFEGIPNQAPETNKPMILNGPTSRNREGSDQIDVHPRDTLSIYDGAGSRGQGKASWATTTTTNNEDDDDRYKIWRPNVGHEMSSEARMNNELQDEHLMA